MKILWRSPTLRSVAIYGASGLGFAGANLILARVLPTEEYGLFTLVIAMVNVGFALATGGVDSVVTRRHLPPGWGLLRRSAAAAVVIALALVSIAALAYDLTIPMLLVVFVSAATGGVMMVAGARFQSEQRYGYSLALVQSPNLVLLLAALAVVLIHGREAWVPLVISTLGFVLAAVFGWRQLLHEGRGRSLNESEFPWREALSFMGLHSAGLLLVQLDRLIIPHVLSVHDLATYGVLAAIAGSLFRVLSMGVGYTLVPRLRTAESVHERRLLIAHEGKLAGAIIAGGAVLIWFITPLIEQWFLAGKYHLAGGLVLATLVSGVAKIANAFTKSIVTVLATPTELSLVNLLGWASVALAVPAAVFGARWGLAGVIYGVALGWILRALTALYFALRHLRLPTPYPATAP